MLTRRTVLGGAALGAVVVAGGLGWTVQNAAAEESLVHATLEKHLGPIAMTEAELGKFVAGFKAEHEYMMPGLKLALAVGPALLVGLDDPLRRVLPSGERAELERFERTLLSAFHVMTSFPFRRGQDAPVVFIAASGCRNPFAQFA